jgi:hypothetical protein
MDIAQLPMDPVMERPTDQDLDEAIGMAVPTDMVAGALGGDILRIKLAIRMY